MMVTVYCDRYSQQNSQQKINKYVKSTILRQNANYYQWYFKTLYVYICIYVQKKIA